MKNNDRTKRQVVTDEELVAALSFDICTRKHNPGAKLPICIECQQKAARQLSELRNSETF